MRPCGRCCLGQKSTECCEPAIYAVSKMDISFHKYIHQTVWKIRDGECWHVHFEAFVTILLKIHWGKIYTKPKEFWSAIWRLIFESCTVILVTFATVFGTISCPVLVYLKFVQSYSVLYRFVNNKVMHIWHHVSPLYI